MVSIVAMCNVLEISEQSTGRFRIVSPRECALPNQRMHDTPDIDKAATTLKQVCVLPVKPGRRPGSHEHQTHLRLAERIATLLRVPFGGECEPAPPPDATRYLVPDDTLVSLDGAAALGITSAAHLFGGVVPHPHVATKTISHALPQGASASPEGWSPRFGERVREVVLPGYAAFAMDDALRAGMELLRDGAVRVKKAAGIGGTGQAVASDPRQLKDTLQRFGDEGAWRDGVVLERNLVDVATHSIGQVVLAGMQISYCGFQSLTRNHHSHEVYGGSRLQVVRGDFDQLLQRTWDDDTLLAIRQARDYHHAALECFAGMFASRCNYDVAQGEDETGHRLSGVLEQSWRIGGASGAEIAALEAFAADPSLDEVCASTVELYEADLELPAGARVMFSGIDAHVGAITKYSRIEPD